MVINRSCRVGKGGWLMAELAIAVALIVVIMIPLGYTYHREHQLSRALYYRAVIMEVVDGETEFLKAGEWKRLQEGENELKPTAAAIANVAPGKLVATKAGPVVRVEWRPGARGKGSLTRREFRTDANHATP